MHWNLRKSHTRRAIALSIGGLFLALVVYQFVGENGYLAARRKWHEEREWRQRNEALLRQNQALERRIHELRTEPKVIEKIAREELMLARPEEKIIHDPQKK